MVDYVFCVRAIRGGAFAPEPATTRFLAVPDASQDIDPSHQMPKAQWVEAVTQDAINGQNQVTRSLTGDIVFFVHGFNVSTATMLERHRLLKAGLEREGWVGAVVSFDWPSATSALNYMEDRTDAKLSALKLVDDGLATFARVQRPECEINMHIVAHSMGAFVVREAFDDADDRPAVAANSWSVSQTVLLSADVSASSLGEGNPKSSSLYRHTVRLTNYANPFDGVLSLSNVKRVGVSPRVGRVGLPSPSPSKAVNVDVGQYFQHHKARFDHLRFPGHIWYFHDQLWMRDLAFTLQGAIDRASIPTRTNGQPGLTLWA